MQTSATTTLPTWAATSNHDFSSANIGSLPTSGSATGPTGHLTSASGNIKRGNGNIGIGMYRHRQHRPANTGNGNTASADWRHLKRPARRCKLQMGNTVINLRYRNIGFGTPQFSQLGHRKPGDYNTGTGNTGSTNSGFALGSGHRHWQPRLTPAYASTLEHQHNTAFNPWQLQHRPNWQHRSIYRTCPEAFLNRQPTASGGATTRPRRCLPELPEIPWSYDRFQH